MLAFLTGVGGIDTFPQTVDLTPVYPLPEALGAIQVTLGGAPVQSLYTGLTPGFIGLAQMNLKLPATLPLGSSLVLSVRIGGAQAPNVNLAVK